jgi:hypothetical protein
LKLLMADADLSSGTVKTVACHLLSVVFSCPLSVVDSRYVASTPTSEIMESEVCQADETQSSSC